MDGWMDGWMDLGDQIANKSKVNGDPKASFGDKRPARACTPAWNVFADI
jgi:hypothetical protein